MSNNIYEDWVINNKMIDLLRFNYKHDCYLICDVIMIVKIIPQFICGKDEF